MTTRTLTLIIAALVIAGAASAVADVPCTVVINGRALEAGEGLTDEAGNLLLSEQALRQGLGLTVERAEDGPWTVRGFGRRLLVRPGSSSFSVNDEMSRAEIAPQLRDGRLFVPLQMAQAVLDISLDRQVEGAASIWLLNTPGSAVLDAREGRHGDSARIVLDLERPTGFSWWVEGNAVVIELPIPADGQRAHSVRLLSLRDELVDQLRQGPTECEMTRVEILHSSPEAPRVFSIPAPPRIVVDLMRSPEDAWIDPEPGIAPEPPVRLRPLPEAAGVLQTRNFTTPRGPVRVYVLDVDPRSPALEVRPSLGSATIHERATVTRMVINSGAWGGVNGGFFCNTGPPLGGLMIDGEWVREPWPGRTVLGILEDGSLMMDRLSFSGEVAFSGLGTLPIHGLNRGHDSDDTLMLYNRHWGATVAGARARTRLAVDAGGTVTRSESEGQVVPIPEGGFVLSGNGGMAESLKKVAEGTSVTTRLSTRPGWQNLRHAIGGGPRIVKDGRPHITAAPEGFRADVHAGAAPRTAVGITAEGRLLLVAVEGLENQRRFGMTLSELASTMIKLGARDAMNLDGGGSTTFVADGRLINSPADGSARRVSNAILVFTREVEAAAAAAEAGGMAIGDEGP